MNSPRESVTVGMLKRDLGIKAWVAILLLPFVVLADLASRTIYSDDL